MSITVLLILPCIQYISNRVCLRTIQQRPTCSSNIAAAEESYKDEEAHVRTYRIHIYIFRECLAARVLAPAD